MSRRLRGSPRKGGDPSDISPHFAHNEESPLVGQGTTPGATTASPPPTTTTTPNSDAESAKSVKQGVSDVEVGGADPDEATTSTVAQNWDSEGVESLDDKGIRHMNAFHAVLKNWIAKKQFDTKLMTKAEHDKIVDFLLGVQEGTTDCCEEKKSGNGNAYRWLQKYHVFTFGSESAVLVLRPDDQKQGPVDVTAMALKDLQRPTYAERMFADLWKIHQSDHCKGVTFYYRVRDIHGNVSREVCKFFTDVCPHCIVVQSRRKPAAGIQPIITIGMGVRGQVDLVDLQSMPDGDFVYLLNYIDHGVKKLTCIPLVSKRASSVAFALFTIFTEVGPPSVLQTDNGGEFSNHAHDYVGRRILLDDEFIDLVIKELKNLMVWCKPTWVKK